MIFQTRVLDAAVAYQLAAKVDILEGWRAGDETAGENIRGRKQNEQLMGAAAPQELKLAAAQAMGSAPVVQRIGSSVIGEPRFARYRQGDHYGWHVDGALAGYVPCDVSMSLILRTGKGGEIRIRLGDLVVTLDPQPGEAAFWASHLEHCIEPVEEGVRIVAIAGVTCMVKDPVAREVASRLCAVAPFVPPEARNDYAFALTNTLRLHKS